MSMRPGTTRRPAWIYSAMRASEDAFVSSTAAIDLFAVGVGLVQALADVRDFAVLQEDVQVVFQPVSGIDYFSTSALRQ